jgi:hypothetical protein
MYWPMFFTLKCAVSCCMVSNVSQSIEKSETETLPAATTDAVTVGDGVAVATGDALAMAVAEGEAFAIGVGVSVAVGDAVAVGEAVGDGLVQPAIATMKTTSNEAIM